MLPKPDGTVIHVAVGSVISMSWSPDGARLAGAVINLLAVNPGAAATAKMPAGSDLVPTEKGKALSGVFMFGLDGGPIPNTRPLGLLFGGLAGPQNPIFSADGTNVDFELWPSTSPDPSKIIGIAQQSSDGSQQMRLFLKGPWTNFRWAPDGVHLSANAPVHGKPDKEDIVVGDTTTGKLTNLTKGTAYATGGDWSLQSATAN